MGGGAQCGDWSDAYVPSCFPPPSPIELIWVKMATTEDAISFQQPTADPWSSLALTWRSDCGNIWPCRSLAMRTVLTLVVLLSESLPSTCPPPPAVKQHPHETKQQREPLAFLISIASFTRSNLIAVRIKCSSTSSSTSLRQPRNRKGFPIIPLSVMYRLSLPLKGDTLLSASLRISNRYVRKPSWRVAVRLCLSFTQLTLVD